MNWPGPAMPFSSRMMHRNARENVGRMVESKCADDVYDDDVYYYIRWRLKLEVLYVCFSFLFDFSFYNKQLGRE